jgi:hypothetical protein
MKLCVTTPDSRLYKTILFTIYSRDRARQEIEKPSTPNLIVLPVVCAPESWQQSLATEHCSVQSSLGEIHSHHKPRSVGNCCLEKVSLSVNSLRRLVWRFCSTVFVFKTASLRTRSAVYGGVWVFLSFRRFQSERIVFLHFFY